MNQVYELSKEIDSIYDTKSTHHVSRMAGDISSGEKYKETTTVLVNSVTYRNLFKCLRYHKNTMMTCPVFRFFMQPNA